MGFFGGKTKKQAAATTSQGLAAAPIHSSQPNVQIPYQQYGVPQQSWVSIDQRPNTATGYGYGSQSQGWVANQQPIFITQNYILPPSLPQNSLKSSAISKLNLGSVSNLLAGDVPACIPGARMFNEGLPTLQLPGSQYLNQGTALGDLISTKFNTVITLIDGERFSGDERELVVCPPAQPIWQQEHVESGYSDRDLSKGRSKGVVNNTISTALVSTNYFAKVNLYANSRLPPNQRPMRLYVPTFPILCLAAQYSERVYTRPAGKERETHVDADWREGTKAMVMKSVPMDDINTIVFAIRGTQTFMDWAVNLKSAPASPDRFLDDPGNLCHAGFLTVAKKMIKPVAARLRHLLEEDPSRSKYSLLITGHSAGGAVAALLYSHMISTSPEAESELNILTGCFKRVHCVSFGAPPVSLLPLAKSSDPRLRKSLFLSFVNEGDPVPRADKAYVRSLLDLYSTPAPGQSCLDSVTPQRLQPLVSSLAGKSSSSLAVNKIRPTPKKSRSAPVPGLPPVWRVPQATLSNAGTLVLLRSVERYESRPNRKKHVQERMDEGVVAQMITDEQLRGVIWGDPVCHMMRLYVRRIEILAMNAVTGR